MANITEQQVIKLEVHADFKDVTKQFVRNRALYLTTQNGTTGNLDNLTPENWARQRVIAKAIVLHPNSQDYQEWVNQFLMFLKGQDVWDTDEATTVIGMINSGKFDELTRLTFALRADRIEF